MLGGEKPPPTPRELLEALRYPDRSVVIDLSHVLQDEKIDYIRTVLPALNVMRRRTGLPHRILLDEAHYFLLNTGAHRLLDLETNTALARDSTLPHLAAWTERGAVAIVDSEFPQMSWRR